MTQITVTADNIGMVQGAIPCDQAADLEIGCVVTRWSPGDVLMADEQLNSEPITTVRWPDGHGGWCYCGASGRLWPAGG